MLRLVHPVPPGQEPRRPKGRVSASFSLSTDERRHLAAALHNLRRAYGSWGCLVKVMGTNLASLMRAARPKNPIGTPALAFIAARAGGMSLEAVISGTLSAVGKCESCGSRLGHGMTARAAGGAL